MALAWCCAPGTGDSLRLLCAPSSSSHQPAAARRHVPTLGDVSAGSPSMSKPLSLAMGLTLITAAGKALRREQRRKRNRSKVIVAADDGGDWTTYVSRIGPPLPQEALQSNASAEARWHAGAAMAQRIAWHEDDTITAMALHEETLCIGTRSGAVHVVDVDSGCIVGRYFVGGTEPPTRITALHFDGKVVMAGDEKGRVYVWRAAFPGSWGFHHSPEWILCRSDLAGAAHKARVTGICLLQNTFIVTSDEAGEIVYWSQVGTDKTVREAHIVALKSSVNCMCIDRRRSNCIYAGADEGLIELTGTSNSDEVHKSFLEKKKAKYHSPCALAYSATEDSLFVGRKNGGIDAWQRGASGAMAQELHFSTFHVPAIHHLHVGGRRIISTAADGRICVWDASNGKPLWGLQGFHDCGAVALADSRRLICSGVSVRTPRPQLSNAWRDWRHPSMPRCSPENKSAWTWPAPACEGVLCLDFADRPSQPKEIDIVKSHESAL